MLGAYEKYYFGLSYKDDKGETTWLKMEKKVLKQEARLTDDHLEMEFRIRFYPVDVTQVLQYVTLYQVFLTTHEAIVTDELDVSNKDAFMLAALYLQAKRGDCTEGADVLDAVSKESLIPSRNMRALSQELQAQLDDINRFFAEEIVRIWRSLQGILRHLAVLKYMQITQKHPRFAMQYFDIKNKKGTPLTLGVNQHGLAVYRHSKMARPVVSFSWAECSELAFTDKKFTIQVHNRETKAFSVYTHRSKMCQRILDLCIGLHSLYVLALYEARRCRAARPRVPWRPPTAPLRAQPPHVHSLALTQSLTLALASATVPS